MHSNGYSSFPVCLSVSMSVRSFLSLHGHYADMALLTKKTEITTTKFINELSGM